MLSGQQKRNVMGLPVGATEELSKAQTRSEDSSVSEKKIKVECDEHEIIVLPDAYSSPDPLSENETCSDGVGGIDHPPCWSLEQYLNKCKEYTWLTASNGKLGCKVCRDVKNIEEESEGMHVSVEWADCLVSAFGDTRGKQQVALRKKIFHHKNSNCHQKAGAIIQSRNDESVAQFSVKMQVSGVFRTAYNIAKQGRPFTDLPLDIDLQTLNGADLGRLLHSDHSCADIIDHIAAQMRLRLVQQILLNESKISVLLDECRTYSNMTILIVSIRASFGDHEDPLTVFLDLVELPEKTAEVILDKLFSCLEKFGFTNKYLRAHLIQLVVDCASPLVGTTSGVGELMKEKYPQLVVWRCASHRLELLAGEVSKEVTGMNQLTVFFDKLFATYHASPRNRRELGDCAPELEGRLLKVGKILEVDWVASSVTSVHALWNSYAVLSKHFCDSSMDSKRSETERKKYASLHRMLTSAAFVYNLGVLYDAVTELEDLSQQLQRPDMTIYEADRVLHRQSCVFASMTTSPGLFSRAAATAMDDLEFQGVKLDQVSTKGCISIDRVQFFTELANKVQQRMTTVSHDPLNTTASPAEMEYKVLVQTMKLMDPDTWPEPVDILYGDVELQLFCSTFHIDDVREYINAFRDYKQHKDCEFPEKLRPLKCVVKTFTTSMSECECVVSTMNDVLTYLRSRMAIHRLSSVLFIKIVGPPLTEFRPAHYVQKWFEKGRRSADATKAMGRRLAPAHTSAFQAIWDVL